MVVQRRDPGPPRAGCPSSAERLLSMAGRSGSSSRRDDLATIGHARYWGVACSSRVWSQGMTSARRSGAPDAEARGRLLDAAEQLMIEEGYAAVTSRRLAHKAGLKPQLVHYYFRTMEELFLEVFRRR